MPLIGDMSVRQLKEELRKYQAKVSGRKKELVERLEYFRRNKDSCVNLEKEWNMQLPNYNDFKDLHSGMKHDVPPVKEERIKEYLGLFEKDWEEKYTDLYNERYIRFVRLYRDEKSCFLTACMWAEMSKTTAYRVDVSLHDTGVVNETQCECGAGQGPNAHCKHVATVLYGLVQFREQGEILTELTCTQQLQTFHKAKNYSGSPMKCEELQILRGQHNIDYDPRQPQFRNRSGKMDRLEQLCLNHQLSNMAAMQLFDPANPVALTTDHDYCNDYDTDAFLERENVTAVTSEFVKATEECTRGQTKSNQWKIEHEKRITASNFGLICKMVRADGHKIARNLISPRNIVTPAILHGRKYENIAIEAFEKTLGTKTKKCGLYIMEEYPFLAATPDAIVDGDTIIEVKCPYSAKDKHISETTVDYLVCIDGELTLSTKHNYFYQVQGQMMCTNASVCYFCIYTFKEFRFIKVARDTVFINAMKEKLVQFFHSYFCSAVVEKQIYRDYNTIFY